MTTTSTTHVDADLLELLAFESGQTIELRPDYATLRIGHRLFVAPLPLPLPEQRQAGEES